MDLSLQKEQFSRAYVRAVAAAAAFAAEEPKVDDDSVDMQVCARGGEGTTRSPRLEIQVKCTSGDILGDEHLTFFLKKKNYDDLRATTLVPRCLVVVVVPEDVNLWLAHSEAELLVRHCGYWSALRGLPPTDNTSGMTVKIPRANLFDVEQLKAIMTRIGSGGMP